MRAIDGCASLLVRQGRRVAWMNVLGVDDGWQWQAGERSSRDSAEGIWVEGKAKTWAGAYRAGMRAAERLLGGIAP